MNREKLNRHKKNKRELALIERQLERLQERLESVETVSGKVAKSGDDFPYIEEHVTVQMAEPKAASAIKDRIREKEDRRGQLLAEIVEVESFILGLPDGMEKQAIEIVYLDGENQYDTADALGITQGRVSQIIKKICEN